MEGAGLQCREPLGHQLRPAVDEARLLGAILQRLPGDLVVVGLVRLTEIGRVGVGDGALLPHPVERGARVEAAGKRDADFLADGDRLQDV